MPIQIAQYAEPHVAAVRSFNRRLAGGGVPFQFPESPVPSWLPRRAAAPLYQEIFVAVDGRAVRGGYSLKSQPFEINGEPHRVACLKLPLSEGTVDPRYGIVGAHLLKDAQARQPMLFALGMGGLERPFPQVLKRLKWSLVSCPFYFKVNRPFRFLRRIAVLRQRRSRRLLLDAAAYSGLGAVALRGVHAWRGRRARPHDPASEIVPEFSGWADELWKQSRGAYSMVAVRDAAVLRTLYPASDKRFIRLCALRGGEPVGWAVMLDTSMSGHKQFGTLRVGSLVDCLCIPGTEARLVAAATRHLEERGVDLIVTNQLHHAWGEAVLQSGYLRGPSNFGFAVSPRLAAALEPFAREVHRVHMTRGDGDGPIHL
jgi:hypothetical protein